MIKILVDFFDFAAKFSGIALCILLNLSAARTMLLKSREREPILQKSTAAFLSIFIFALALHLAVL
ncbi:MAG: hypothetical protein KGH54_00380 [Candidatus Micrarchaeota archaeon]|nr:hypothetical protein [Candidatus Micrarchaeota archaeon]